MELHPPFTKNLIHGSEHVSGKSRPQTVTKQCSAPSRRTLNPSVVQSYHWFKYFLDRLSPDRKTVWQTGKNDDVNMSINTLRFCNRQKVFDFTSLSGFVCGYHKWVEGNPQVFIVWYSWKFLTFWQKMNRCFRSEWKYMHFVFLILLIKWLPCSHLSKDSKSKLSFWLIVSIFGLDTKLASSVNFRWTVYLPFDCKTVSKTLVMAWFWLYLFVC